MGFSRNRGVGNGERHGERLGTKSEVRVGRLIKLVASVVISSLLFVPSLPAFAAKAASAPRAAGITPSPASFTAGTAADLTGTFTDADGWQNLKQAFLLIGTSYKNRSGSVYVRYTQNVNRLSLRNDADTDWTSCSPGEATILTNSQVSINCAASAVTGSGNSLNVTVDLNFASTMAGKSLSAFLRAVDDSGRASKWLSSGTVTVTNPSSLPPDPIPGGKYDWVTYYGSGALADLGKFGLVNIDAQTDAYTANDIATLKAGGSRVISYLNTSAAENFRSYWSQASAYKLGMYYGWSGEYWMDVSNPGFRDLIVNTVAPEIIAKGVDGFFLDNIDIVDEYPNRADIRQGLVELVRELRAKYPDKVLIGNTYGLTPMSDTGTDGKQFYQYLNGVAKEEVNSTYTSGYTKVPLAESDSMLQELAGWKAKGLEIYVLDYGTTDTLASYDYNRSTQYGFHPYVSDMNLDHVYIWSFAPTTSLALSPDAPDVVFTGVAADWASYGDYLARVLTVNVHVANVGDSVAVNTAIDSAVTAPRMRQASGGGGPKQLGSGQDDVVRLRFVLPDGMRQFVMQAHMTYDDGTGNLFDNNDF